MEMDINGLGSDDDIEEGRFSWTEAERTFEDRPVIDTATRLSADMHQETLVARKATGSSERAADRNEDLGAQFKKNVAFMCMTLPKEAVPYPVLVQLKAISMSSSQIEETPKVEVALSLFVKAKFGKLSCELGGSADASDSANS